MRIVLAPYGSYGDVLPMVPLAQRLIAEGHDVLVCGPPEHEDLRKELGCDYRHFGKDVYRQTRSAPEPATHPFAGSVAILRFMADQLESHVDQLRSLAAHADILVACGINVAGGIAARILGISYQYIAFCPSLIPARSQPPDTVRFHHMPDWLNSLAWKAQYALITQAMRPAVKRIESKAGARIVSHPVTAWLGTHPIVASDPILGKIPDDARLPTIQTGFHEYEREASLPPDLEEFLDKGPPPVYVGFGSMMNDSPRDMTALVVGAARGAGQRLVVAAGWAGLGADNPGPDCYFTDNRLAHKRLFPRVATAVHHGGCGTVSTAARAGIPQVIVPHIADQFYWAHQVAEVGIGPRGVPRSRLSVERLQAAIHAAVSEPRFMARATQVKNALSVTDGVSLTAKAIVEAASPKPPRDPK